MTDAYTEIRRLVDELEAAALRERMADRVLPVERVIPPAPVWAIAMPFFWVADTERALVTRRVFRHLSNVRDQLGVRVTGVGSEGKVSRSLWCEFFDEVDYREYPQTFQANHAGGEGLRAKFDETVRATRHLEQERVFIGGSDDIIPVDWYAKAFQSDADLVGITGGATIVKVQASRPASAVVWDGCYRHASDVEFCGGGLMFSRRLLEGLGWAPFRNPGDEVGIERDVRAHAADGWTVEGVHGPFFAVKCRKVLNQVQASTRHGATPADRLALARFVAVWESLA